MFFRKINWQRGEIATTLTVIGVAVMAVGALIGAQLTQNSQDIRSSAQNSCVLSSNPTVVSVDQSKVVCRYTTTAVSEGYTCALVDENEQPGNQVTAGQNIPWEGTWSGTTATVPLYFKSGKSINSNHSYTLVVFNSALGDSCKRTTPYTGSALANMSGNPQPTAPPNPTSPPAATNTPIPTTPTCSTGFSSRATCNNECGGSAYCENVPGISGCFRCKTPTATPSRCSTGFASLTLCGTECNGTQNCESTGVSGCFRCKVPTATPTPTRSASRATNTPTPTRTPTPVSFQTQCNLTQNGFCMNLTNISAARNECQNFSANWDISDSKFGCQNFCCAPKNVANQPTWSPTPTVTQTPTPTVQVKPTTYPEGSLYRSTRNYNISIRAINCSSQQFDYIRKTLQATEETTTVRLTYQVDKSNADSLVFNTSQLKSKGASGVNIAEIYCN